jgi:hypothetical protein
MSRVSISLVENSELLVAIVVWLRDANVFVVISLFVSAGGTSPRNGRRTRLARQMPTNVVFV